MKQDRRGSWYLLTGAVLGIALGLVYSWVVSPVKFVDAPPSALRADYKDDYRALVAAAYLYSHDLVRAKERLAQLKDDEIAQTLALQAQRAMAEGLDEEEVLALNALANAINESVTPVPTMTAPSPEVNLLPLIDNPVSPQGTITATDNPSVDLVNLAPSQTMVPTNDPDIISASQTITPLPIVEGSFVLEEKRLVCNVNQGTPLIQVEVMDAAGQPVSGVEVVVIWEAGEDHFFTGLQPELGVGYADFTMTPGVVYSVHLAGDDQVESNITAAECIGNDQTRYWGSWNLLYKQP